MKAAGSHSILIPDKPPDNSAEPFHVEIGVLDLERIEGPLDQIDVARDCVFALPQLEPPADARVPEFGKDAQHVAVQVRLRTLLQPRNRKAKRDHASRVIRAKRLSAHLGGGDEETNGKQFDFIESPDCLLQPYRFAELMSGREGLDLNQRRFASCHRASSSAIGVAATCLFCSLRRLSMCAKRSRNFALERRSACSGSTFTKRARFTITNKRSPNSSSSWSAEAV